jgi:hypothetical protein
MFYWMSGPDFVVVLEEVNVVVMLVVMVVVI